MDLVFVFDLDLVGLRGLELGSLREGVEDEEEAPRARLSLVRKGIFDLGGRVGVVEEVVVVVVVVVVVGVRWRIGFGGRGGRM